MKLFTTENSLVLLVISLFVVSIICSVNVSAAGWPMYMHDGNHSAVADGSSIDSSNAANLTLKWSYSESQGEEYYSPVVVNQGGTPVVVFSLSNKTVVLLNGNQGSVLGSFACNGSYAIGAGAIANNVLYIGCGFSGLYAVDISNPSSLVPSWKHNATLPGWTEVSPVVSNGIVYTASYADNVSAINIANGVTVWTRNLTQGAGGMASSPALANGVLFIGTKGNTTFALNATNGTKLWNFTAPWIYNNSVDSSPVISNGTVYIGSDDNKTYAINASTGAEIWNFTTGGALGYVAPIVANGKAYFGSHDGTMYAVNANTGVSIWNYTTGGSIDYPAALSNDVLIFESNDLNLYAVKASDGTLLKQISSSEYLSAPVVYGGYVFVRSSEGSIYAFNISSNQTQSNGGSGQGGGCNGLLCLADAFNTTGNETVAVCAGTSIPIKGFNFWYNGTGPLNISNGGIVSSSYYFTFNRTTNETSYAETNLTNVTAPNCVAAVLNSSFTNTTIQVNVSLYNISTYSVASNQCSQGSGCNGTMFTINYVSIETQDASKNPLGNVMFMAFNNGTKSYISSGPALTDSSGYWAEHCNGYVQGGNCLNATANTGDIPNSCTVRGIGFPNVYDECGINSTSTINAFDFIYSNSTQGNVTPGTPLVLSMSTRAVAAMVMPFVWSPDVQNNNMQPLTAAQINISNYTTNELYTATSSGGENQGTLPAFIEPFKLYKISFVYGGSIFSYPFMTSSAGMTSAQIMIGNTSNFPLSTGYKTVVGKVVNENGTAVSNAVVYGQMFKGPSNFGISFFNSSVTDSNGIFSMRLPRSRPPSENGQGGNNYFPLYQFYIISNARNASNGVPIYFTTTDTNNNKGYFALSDVVTVPPLLLKSGGQININVTLNTSRMIISELSKFLSLGTGVVRDAVSGQFTMTSMFDNVAPPTSMLMSLLSPVGFSAINLFGKNMSMGDPMSGIITKTCTNASVAVRPGLTTDVNCILNQPGYLNLIVLTCNDVFTHSYCSANNPRAGTFDFWYQANGVLRNSTSGQVVAYLEPDGTLINSILSGTEATNITIPLPAGNYTLELTSPFEHSQQLNVYNGTSIMIIPGLTNNTQLVRGNSWDIEPMFNPSLVLSGNNAINVSVIGMNGHLNTSYVTLNGTQILLLNKSFVNSTNNIIFSYDPNNAGGIFYNTTFNPASLNLSAGKYWLMLNATNYTVPDRFTTTFLMPVNMFDFQLGVDFGGFSFGSGQTIYGKIFAYNTSTGGQPVGLNATANNVTVQIYDMTGVNVTNISVSKSAVVNGQGLINITLPQALGYYEIVTGATVDTCIATVAQGCKNGTAGVADNWLQVSSFNIKVTTDKPNYQPSDSVVVAVQVLNSSNSAPVSGASVSVTVDNSNTPAVSSTGSDGKATVTLDAANYGTNGQWLFSWHNLRIKISKQTGSDVLNLETGSGFDVRGMNLFIRTDRPSYSQSDIVYIDVYGPPGFSIGGVAVDGTALTSCNTYTCPVRGVSYGLIAPGGSNPNYGQVNLSSWNVGHHDVAITASSGSSQTFHMGFDVNSYNIMLSTSNFVYNLNSNISLAVKATYPNGTSVNNSIVNVTLFKAQPPNDIFVAQSSNTTNSSGQTTFNFLNATQPGFNYVRVNVSGQLQYIGVQVSSLKVNLLSAAGGSAVSNYNAAPGDTVAIYVNATSGGNNVADGSTVTAKIWAFGNSIDLSPNTTTSGNATIYFQVPSFAAAQNYGLEVRLTSPSGEQGFAPPASLTVTGGAALQLSVSTDRSFQNPYKPGDNATFSAALSYPNGTAVPGYNVTFEIGSEQGQPQTVGSAVTGAGGSASKTYSISSNQTDGPYFLHVFIANSSDIQAFSGFVVSSVYVNASTDKSVYALGENITVSVTVFNRTTGSQVNATGGFIKLFSKDKGEINQIISPAGLAQPYNVSMALPNESSAVGTYPIGVAMAVNQTQGFGFVLVDVRNSSLTLNLTLPSSITAGVPFFANLSASSGSTATLRIFAPGAQSLIYENTSVSLSGTPPSASLNMTISSPGIYVFQGFASGIGGVTQIVSVLPPTSGTIPAVWTGTSTSTNATSFGTTQSVYVMSNVANATATILTVDSTNTTVAYSLPLTLNTTSTYYGIFDSSNLVGGRKYFVRLDTSTSSSLATTMFGAVS